MADLLSVYRVIPSTKASALERELFIAELMAELTERVARLEAQAPKPKAKAPDPIRKFFDAPYRSCKTQEDKDFAGNLIAHRRESINEIELRTT